MKKRKYVYYHCTGNRGKCEEPHTRQEILAREFAEVLQELVIPQPIQAPNLSRRRSRVRAPASPPFLSIAYAASPMRACHRNRKKWWPQRAHRQG